MPARELRDVAVQVLGARYGVFADEAMQGQLVCGKIARNRGVQECYTVAQSAIINLVQAFHTLAELSGITA